MVALKRRCNRSTVIIAGALFVSPLAVAAFRTPSPLAFQPVGGGLASQKCPRRVQVSASVVSDSLDADAQQASLTGNLRDASDIMNQAVEHSPANGVTGADLANGEVDLEYEKEQLNQQMQKPPQRQKNRQNVKKSRKNNKAMADPDFLRKRTETLNVHVLRMTKGGYDSSDLDAGTLKVDKRTFDWLIDAWAYSGEYDAADKALKLLSRMEELRDLNIAGVAPDAKSYTKVVNAIARSGRRDAGEQAEEILDRMIRDTQYDLRPNTYTYTYVIDAYARSPTPKSPHAAQRLIEEMERLRAAGDPDVRPTTRAWNSVISAWAQWKGEEMAWGHIGSGAERAEACLDIMEEWADTTGNEEVRPNSYNYNSVISALAHSQDEGAASRAEKILERMENLHRTTGDEDVKPRTATYNAIIDAWAKSGEMDAANRAELLLAHMMELHETGQNLNAKPNVRSFNSVLNAWAKSGHPMAPEKASDVVMRMEDLNKNTDLQVSPDATSFATAINAYARSNRYEKAQSAYDIFMYMSGLHNRTGKKSLRPNNVVYNSVLNACAFTVGDLDEQSQAIEIANAMLKGLDESPYGKPDQVTYGTYLKVINNQMPPSEPRDQVVETLFRKCAKDGMVGEMVLRQLREMGLEEVYESLMGGQMWGETKLSDLPHEWTCNVIEGKRMRRRQFRR